MKGIIIRSNKEEYKLEFNKGYLIIEEQVEESVVATKKTKIGDVVPSKGTKYEAYINKAGKKTYRLKKGMKRGDGVNGTKKSRREASLRAWETKRQNARDKEIATNQVDKYDGLVNLNQLENNE